MKILASWCHPKKFWWIFAAILSALSHWANPSPISLTWVGWSVPYGLSPSLIWWHYRENQWGIPSGNLIACHWNCPFIVSFPIRNCMKLCFSTVMVIYQRVSPSINHPWHSERLVWIESTQPFGWLPWWSFACLVSDSERRWIWEKTKMMINQWQPWQPWDPETPGKSQLFYWLLGGVAVMDVMNIEKSWI